MALVYDGMSCMLCGKPIDDFSDSSTFFATTRVGGMPAHLAYDDCAAHQCCVDGWPLKEAFVREYNSKFRSPQLAIDSNGHVYHHRDWTEFYFWVSLPLMLVLAPIFLSISWTYEKLRPLPK
ncbi:hypothetical protein [Anatilimnocola floriformis]|uniref:hypothetical protein n=1 Tax=Anatilimnocola floriformis TaxID=2948575 RepID=UPI0020C58D94|nr:hypothetical protein [Anatilimnocola floriformis]